MFSALFFCVIIFLLAFSVHQVRIVQIAKSIFSSISNRFSILFCSNIFRHYPIFLLHRSIEEVLICCPIYVFKILLDLSVLGRANNPTKFTYSVFLFEGNYAKESFLICSLPNNALLEKIGNISLFKNMGLDIVEY
jgi:hypothetical protein